MSSTIPLDERVNRVDKLFRKTVGEMDRLIVDLRRMVVPYATKRPKIQAIQEVVCQNYEIPFEAMTTQSKVHSYSRPRQIAMHLCRELTKHAVKDIGEEFGGREHTTVTYANKMVIKWLGSQPKLRDEMEQLRVLCQSKIDNLETPLFDINAPAMKGAKR